MVATLAQVLFLAGALGASEISPMTADAPDREPQMAVKGSTVALTFGSGQGIYFSRSVDSGVTFSSPVRVGGGEIIPLSRHRGPRIAFAGSSIVITAVVGKTAAQGAHAHGLPSDGDLLAWRSADGGKTWTSGVVVNDNAASATEGLHALAADSKGRLFAVWLDKRSGATQLYGALSVNGGGSWSPNVAIYTSPDGTICQCCHPSAAFDHDQLVVMWRNCLDGARDMYLARSNDGVRFAPPEKLGAGTWKLNACPMDGGGIAISDGGIITAWRRERSLFLARPGQAEQLIGEGTDIAIASAKTGTYAVWSTAAGIELMTPSEVHPRILVEKGAFPTIAPLKKGALVAWESDGKILLRRVL